MPGFKKRAGVWRKVKRSTMKGARRTRNKARSSKNLISKVKKAVGQLSEKKYKIYMNHGTLQLTASTHQAFTNMIGLTWPNVGTGVDQRVGARIFIRYIKGFIDMNYIKAANNVNTPIAQTCRLVIIKSKYALPYIDDYFEGAMIQNSADGMSALPKNNNPPIIYDKIIKTPRDADYAVGALVEWRHKFKIRIMKSYEIDGNGTFNHAEYYMMTMPCTAALPQIIGTLSWKLTFTDN